MDKPSILPSPRRLPSERQVKRLARSMQNNIPRSYQGYLDEISRDNGFPDWGSMKRAITEENDDAR